MNSRVLCPLKGDGSWDSVQLLRSSKGKWCLESSLPFSQLHHIERSLVFPKWEKVAHMGVPGAAGGGASLVKRLLGLMQ